MLPSDETSPEQIEDIMSMLNEMGINVVESEEEGNDTAKTAKEEEAEPSENLPIKVEAEKTPADRTDDPVRMYLREMGQVELLSREGEIAIAKRIEAGREAMIQGLCESPLTFQAIIIWRDELNEGKILLRDIIDLEATYAGPDAKNKQPVMSDEKLAEPKKPEPIKKPESRAAPCAATMNMAMCCRRKISTSRRSRKKRTTRATIRASRSRPWKPSSSRKCSRPSTASPRPTSRCASCRTRKSATRPLFRPRRSAATRSCATRSSSM